MTDQSNAPHIADAEALSEEDKEAYLGFISMVADQLADGLDHPDIWQILADMADADYIPQLIAYLEELQPMQAENRVAKVLELMAYVLTTVAVDQGEGLAALKQMEVFHPLCPQVAGACFFAERWNHPTKSADLSTKFCESPFIKFETLIDGHVAPCCSIWTKKRLGHLEHQSFAEIWNSPDAVEMRESILDGSYRFCNKQRCTLIMEDALPERDSITDPFLRDVIDNDRAVIPESPKWLFLAHDMTCNLSCPSCRDKLLGADEAQEARFAKVEQQVFFPLLNAEGEVTISVSGQGDPWSSQHYRSILRYMADHDLQAKLNIHSNALLMSEQRWNSYLGLEKYRPLVDISIDACSPWAYEIVRRPGNWSKLEPNLRFISAKRAAGTFSEFHINATIQLDNFHEMPGLVDFAQSLGCDSVRFYMMQNTGGHIADDYARKNVGDVAHPLHLAFLETLRDPKLGLAIAHLYDVATWRNISLETRLPSDDLGADYTREDLYAALEGAIAREDLPATAALCAAGRIRFPEDIDLYAIEARALQRLGFNLQAGYREKMAAAFEAGTPSWGPVAPVEKKARA